MAADMSITVHQLQELVERVRKTKHAQTIRLADDVIAVVSPEQRPAPRPSQRPARRTSAAPRYSLESAYGAVSDAGGPRDFDRMIREAKEERAERLQRSL